MPKVSRKKLIAAGVIGNVVEYYDFALIGFLALIIGRLFFPTQDPFLSLLGSFGAFAAGMIMRPLGAIIFGHMTDRIGRRFAMLSSLALMAIPTFLIGFLPTYEQVGLIAPVALVLLRMLQGLSVGGEYASSIVYLVEQSSQNRQNLYGSFVSIGAKIGMALGSGVCAGLLWYLGDEQMSEWGWRIPFYFSLVIALAGFYLRKNLSENYEAPKERKVPIVEIFKNHKKEFFNFLLIASSIWIFYYTIFIYLPIWLESFAGLSKTQSSTINTITITVGAIFIPIMAILADKIGSIKTMKIAALLSMICVYPLMYFMGNGGFYMAMGGSVILVILLCMYQAPIFASTVFALKEHSYRGSFTALILGSAAGIVGGLTPAMMSSIQKITSLPLSVAVVITFSSFVGWLTLKKVKV